MIQTRTTLSLAFGALLALGAGTALANTASTEPSGPEDTSVSYPGAQSEKAGQGQSGASNIESIGVIQSVNAKKHALTLIVPKEVSTTYRKTGGFTELSSQLDMASLSVPVAKDAQVEVDGQQASFQELKMGDSVRVSFDPHQKRIVRIQATSLNNSAKAQPGMQEGEKGMQQPAEPEMQKGEQPMQKEQKEMPQPGSTEPSPTEQP